MTNSLAVKLEGDWRGNAAAPGGIADAGALARFLQWHLLDDMAESPTLFARFPVHYHAAPPCLRAWILPLLTRFRSGSMRHTLTERQLDLPANDLIISPASSSPPFLLTFDVDSRAGYDNLARFVRALREVGINRAVFFIPARGYAYDAEQLQELRASGFEIGCHGHDHSGKLPFASAAEQERKIEDIREFAEMFGITKFRAPAFTMTRRLLSLIEDVFTEDMSFRDFYLAGRVRGLAYSRPFQLSRRREISQNTLPDSFLYSLGFAAEEMARLWMEKYRYLRAHRVPAATYWNGVLFPVDTATRLLCECGPPRTDISTLGSTVCWRDFNV